MPLLCSAVVRSRWRACTLVGRKGRAKKGRGTRKRDKKAPPLMISRYIIRNTRRRTLDRRYNGIAVRRSLCQPRANSAGMRCAMLYQGARRHLRFSEILTPVTKIVYHTCVPTRKNFRFVESADSWWTRQRLVRFTEHYSFTGEKRWA